jgi:hypothetical protein
LVNSRRGMSRMGCLFSLLIVCVIVYVGADFAKVYWRYYQFQDDVQQQVRFAGHRTNDQILVHLRATVDSLSLPDDAKSIVIKRNAQAISIDVEYDERIEFPKYSRDLHFHPHAEGPL